MLLSGAVAGLVGLPELLGRDLRLHAELPDGLRLHRHRDRAARPQQPGRDGDRRAALGVPRQVRAGPGQHRRAAEIVTIMQGVDRAVGGRRVRDRPALRTGRRAAAGSRAAQLRRRGAGRSRRPGPASTASRIATAAASGRRRPPLRQRGGCPGLGASAMTVAIGDRRRCRSPLRCSPAQLRADLERHRPGGGHAAAADPARRARRAVVRARRRGQHRARRHDDPRHLGRGAGPATSGGRGLGLLGGHRRSARSAGCCTPSRR